MLLDRSLVYRCVVLMLQAVSRFCLRHGIRLPDVYECSKQAMVKAAAAELISRGERVNTSRISAMTGVHRRDVMRMTADDNPTTTASERDLITKVMGKWTSASSYTTKSGEPRVLDCEGDKSEFVELVRSISGDLNPSTVLFELLRIGAVERTRTGLRLLARSFLQNDNLEDGFNYFAKDSSDLARVIEGNILEKRSLPNFHARTEYDNVRPEGIEKLKRWFLQEGHHLHNRAREVIGEFDQDINPDPKFKGKGQRVVLGAFSYVDEDK